MTERKKTISVPVGLEQLLVTAAIDPDFRRELLAKRGDVAIRRGLELTESERSMLTHATGEQIEAMIDRIDTSERNLERRGFLRAVAAAAITLAAGTGLEACGGSGDKPPSETDAPFQGETQKVESNKLELQLDQTSKPTGIRPDEPDAGAPTLDINEPSPQSSAGVRPRD